LELIEKGIAGFLELFETFVIPVVEDVLLEELPESLNQVEV